ncbi:hypothetical protein [Dinghuibacter silviterrae]|uniref:Uncharacterized protein n=1 Tax=Dinghuibacter silviterrae TaxID=1539049 RepID=A0A4R8DW24_9BACT|nr:hypothetical protein [Dinghuibacter silviterrae]TDX02138.1 hypothetical protein EDB95_3188 [Dinghuibacter silviterrae]
MEWYQYVACFFAGIFLANVVPHFVAGVSGNKFPTPFANPPGRGLSSATTNVLWALANLVVGFLLFRVGHLAAGEPFSLLVFFAGIAFISIFASKHFTQKHRE